MKRRDFVTFLSGATAWTATARAQKPQRVIGVLGSASYGAFSGTEAAFIKGLRATGFIEGKNISLWVVLDIAHPDTADTIAPPPVDPAPVRRRNSEG